jgi:hypothetical protein
MARQLHFPLEVGLISEVTGVASWFSSMPRRDAGRFCRRFLPVAIPHNDTHHPLHCYRKCLTESDLSFMMVSSLRKEVVQSNMGICSDCSFIITREVADS